MNDYICKLSMVEASFAGQYPTSGPPAIDLNTATVATPECDLTCGIVCGDREGCMIFAFASGEAWRRSRALSVFCLEANGGTEVLIRRPSWGWK